MAWHGSFSDNRITASLQSTYGIEAPSSFSFSSFFLLDMNEYYYLQRRLISHEEMSLVEFRL